MNKNQRACAVVWSLAVISVVAAQQETVQGPGCRREECVPVAQCPILKERLLENPTEETFKEIRKLTCFVKNRRPSVCCPSPSPPPPPSRRRLATLKSKQSLLPTDCGKSTYIPAFEGEEAPPNAYPWLAILQYRVIEGGNLITNRVVCSGSVISERYVLIPAQCVHRNLTTDRGVTVEEVLLGDWDTSKDPDCTSNGRGRGVCAPPVQRFPIEEVIVHPEFNLRGILSDDVALIRLGRPIDFGRSGGFIQPVCLPQPGETQEPMLSKGGILTSWSFRSQRPHNHILTSVDKAACNKILRDVFVKEQICMQVEEGEPDFIATRGGPLMVSGPSRSTYTQVGILSSKSSSSRVLPGLFTYIPPYMRWIEGSLEP
ncbi:phenoloxidase-activating factor 1-like [Penaeus japonicus]|uniref:phenoloxidase-activating factor 1-like n=1 Tax=Penaeus japonicus TaxID=27405 RepID=UPI001C7133F0|nr:phenoloxidase-activating factor 1-like [Penaeus japonicus]